MLHNHIKNINLIKSSYPVCALKWTHAHARTCTHVKNMRNYLLKKFGKGHELILKFHMRTGNICKDVGYWDGASHVYYHALSNVKKQRHNNNDTNNNKTMKLHC